MKPAIIRHFIGTGPEAAELVREAIVARADSRVALNQLASQYGFDLELVKFGHKERGIGIRAIGFREERQHVPGFRRAPDLDSGSMVRRVGRSGLVPGPDYIYAYKPDKRSKAGKAIAAEFATATVFVLSDFLVGKLGAYRLVSDRANPFGSGVFMISSAASMDEKEKKIYLKVPQRPDGDDDFRSSGGAFDPPAWLREVKESEFLASLGL